MILSVMTFIILCYLIHLQFLGENTVKTKFITNASTFSVMNDTAQKIIEGLLNIVSLLNLVFTFLSLASTDQNRNKCHEKSS